MNELMNLRDKRVQTWNAAKAFLESHRGTDGTLSAEDDAIFNKMMDEVDKLGKEVMRLEKLEALDVEMSKATSKPLSSAPVTRLDEEPVSKTGRGTKDYTRNFWNVMRSKSVSHEVMNALQVGTDTEGGYLVPDEYERTLIEALEDQNIFRQLAHVIHTSSGERKIPVVASKGTASWIDEEAAYPESDDSFGQVSIGAYKLATMIKISEELLNDSVFDMPSYIAKEFARRIGAAEEEAFFTGNGTGRPLGILAATGGAGVGVTAAKADAVTFDEVMDLFYSLRAPYRRNSVFIMNDSTVKALRKLKDGQGQVPVAARCHRRDSGYHPEPPGVHLHLHAHPGDWEQDHPLRRSGLLLGGRPGRPLLQTPERALRAHGSGGLPGFPAGGWQADSA